MRTTTQKGKRPPPLTFEQEKRVREVYRVFSLKATHEILSYLENHGRAQVEDLRQFADTRTLLHRLDQLEQLTLIAAGDGEPHYYTLTEKGRKVLKNMEELVKPPEPGRRKA